MDNENLYQAVKNKICDEIFTGHYQDGDMLPSEREMEKMLDVSRVTVRKSLKILEEDKLIVREVGRGTKITFHNCGNKADLDMIVLIAPARNPFFSEFIGRFQRYAERKGSLVLYVEKPKSEGLESCIYRLYKRGLRNAVIWLEDLQVDKSKLQRLRAIGMNMVFFDSDQGYPYADCAVLDNELAVSTLYQKLKKQGCDEIGFVGWNLEEAYSMRKREEMYLACSEDSSWLWHLPWKHKKEVREAAGEVLLQSSMRGVKALICSDMECGQIISEAAAEMQGSMVIATIDELQYGAENGILMYRQDLQRTVEQIFSCLEEQCTKESDWEADIYKIEGQLV